MINTGDNGFPDSELICLFARKGTGEDLSTILTRTSSEELINSRIGKIVILGSRRFVEITESSRMHRFECNLNIIRALAERATLKGHPQNVIASRPPSRSVDTSIELPRDTGYVDPLCQKSQTISEIFIPVRLNEARLTDNTIRRCLLKIPRLVHTLDPFHHLVACQSGINTPICNRVRNKLMNILSRAGFSFFSPGCNYLWIYYKINTRLLQYYF